FLSKISGIFFDFSDIEQGVSLVSVNERIRRALDVERVTKKFYEEFKDERVAFTDLIQGIEDERDRRWYASVLLNRLMFIYFLQRKLFLDRGNADYLQDKLAESRKRGPDRYYSEFLDLLFFEGFAKPEGERSEEAKKLLG